MKSGDSCVLGIISVSNCGGTNSIISHCQTLDFRSGSPVCTECKDAFGLSNGICVRKNCNGNCNTCDTGYVKPQGGQFCSDCDCKNGYVKSG